MVALDELIYNALQADSDIVYATGGRITSTCFEVSPDEQDNTPLPCIIVTDDGFQQSLSTKDDIWEGDEDTVQAGIEVNAISPREVKQLLLLCRKAVNRHMRTLYLQGNDIPQLQQLTSDGLAWDWMKPCYHERMTYVCTTDNDINTEEEDDEEE